MGTSDGNFVDYDGPSGAYIAWDGQLHQLSEPAAAQALADSAMLAALGYSEKAAEFAEAIRGSREAVHS